MTENLSKHVDKAEFRHIFEQQSVVDEHPSHWFNHLYHLDHAVHVAVVGAGSVFLFKLRERQILFRANSLAEPITSDISAMLSHLIEGNLVRCRQYLLYWGGGKVDVDEGRISWLSLDDRLSRDERLNLDDRLNLMDRLFSGLNWLRFESMSRIFFELGKRPIHFGNG